MSTEPRKVHRSPSYPAFSLTEAIQKAAVIYENEKRSYTTGDVIVGHLGYSQTNGPGGRTLSALRQYGLLDEQEGRYRLSDIGYALVHYPEDSRERTEAVSAAIRKPTLFRELLEEYPEGLPSDATLRSDLLNRGFNPSMIEKAVESFRDSVALERALFVSHTDPEMRNNTQKPMDSMGLSMKSTIIEKAVRALTPSMNQDVFTLEEGDVTIQWPKALSKDSYQDFEDWLDLIKRKAKRAVKPEDNSDLV